MFIYIVLLNLKRAPEELYTYTRKKSAPFFPFADELACVCHYILTASHGGFIPEKCCPLTERLLHPHNEVDIMGGQESWIPRCKYAFLSQIAFALANLAEIFKSTKMGSNSEVSAQQHIGKNFRTENPIFFPLYPYYDCGRTVHCPSGELTTRVSRSELSTKLHNCANSPKVFVHSSQ